MEASAEFGVRHKAHPTAQQVVERDGLVGQLAGRVMLITGASSGIGVETARALYHTGAHLFLPVRDLSKGEKVKAAIEADLSPGRGKIDLLSLDMESLASVRQCAADFLSHSTKLNVLILNAGVMATPAGKTRDGFDMQLGVNHLAHMLLFLLLKPALLSSSTPAFHSRVVSLASSAHRHSGMVWDDVQMDKAPFNTWTAYGQSKTANIYLAYEVERRWGSAGLHGLAVHPGGIWTGLARHLDPDVMRSAGKAMGPWMKTVPQGAATTVWAAVSPAWEGRGGEYLEDCHVAVPWTEQSGPLEGAMPWALDKEQAKRLWAESINMVGMPVDA